MARVVIWCFSIFLFYSCSSSYRYEDKIGEILEVSTVNYTKENIIDEFGGYGEGYAIETYQIEEVAIKEFINNEERSLSLHQKDGYYKFDWSSESNSEISEVLTLVFNYSGSNELNKTLKSIEERIGQDGVFFSFYSKPEDLSSPMDVTFFVVDSEKSRFHVLEVRV